MTPAGRPGQEAYLAADREAEIDRRIQEGYRRMPQGGEYDKDEWGDLGAMTTALGAATLERLAEEEEEEEEEAAAAAAGLGPW